ncbi:hypothetical protein [Azospirillum endophyticum]
MLRVGPIAEQPESWYRQAPPLNLDPAIESFSDTMAIPANLDLVMTRRRLGRASGRTRPSRFTERKQASGKTPLPPLLRLPPTPRPETTASSLPESPFPAIGSPAMRKREA